MNGAADGAPITMVEPAASVRGRRRALTGDLTILAVVGVLLVGAVAAGGAAVYQQFYSPTAFVTRYLEMLAEGRASDALAVPGVSVDAAVLDAAGLPTTSSDALLRSAALGGLSDARVLSEAPRGDDTVVTVAYESGGHAGTTSYLVERAGWIGVVPAWRFAQSPLSIVDLTVRGSMGFSVNGFEVDKRQVSVDPAGADPLAAIPLLVFTPGVYVIAVDTSISTARGVAVVSDVPLANVPVDVQAAATERFVSVVQQRVDEFLTGCATQRVLQPTGCPFGYAVVNRIDDLPTWTITAEPTVSVAPDGANWRIPSARGVAHIQVDVRSLFDGSVRLVDEDVSFFVTGTIVVQADGSASIAVTGLDPQ